MSKRKAFITGISGQDGSYLAEFLLGKGYKVYGFVRRVALEDPRNRLLRILHIIDQIELIPGSLENYPSLTRAISAVMPDEIYHLAAQSFVTYGFEDEFSTLQSNINGTYHVLFATKEIVPNARIYFAASSEMFGNVSESPQNEETPFHPRSAYGISKVAGFYLTINYRETYNIFACNGILYNHESPRRGLEFVTRKITTHAAMIKVGLIDRLELGNLNAKRDWGHAKDYIRAMWLMLQQDEPDDYVISSNTAHSVREFCQKAFSLINLNYEDFLHINPKLYRPAEKYPLIGDSSKARKVLGWKPTYQFDELIEDMVKSDLEYFSAKIR